MSQIKPEDPKLTTETDVEAGTAADVEAVMKKFDRESNTRVWTGKPKLVVSCILVAFSLFCLYVTLFANFLEQVRMTSFMGLVVIMGYLTFPARKGKVRPNSLPWYDIVLMVIGASAFLYYSFNAQAILNTRLKIILTDPKFTMIGLAGIIVLAELCRRSVGLPILCVAIFFIGYTFFSGINVPRVTYEMFYGDNGIMGTPVSVCSKYIVVFIIFGAFLERSGVSGFFINLANSLTGRFVGGPAKVAVISSALCGMVSGSSVGNTVTTGSMTIPMMKKTGYRSEFAGAVEAAASTGGQIMPPIMGAAAFLMADYLGVPYSDIITRAILPAILYFLGIFIAVHLEAKKLGLKGIDRSLLPRFRALLKDTYLLLPLIVLIWLVCSNTRTMQFSAAVSILVAIGVGVIGNLLNYHRARKEAKASFSAGKMAGAAIGLDGGFTGRSILESLEAGGRSCITVAVACGIAGIICGCITVTGLANKLISGIVSISGSSMLLGLFLTMLCCIVLGMGVPTTATYCIMASTCAPILIQMGVPAIAAHFFVFYYGIVADITPPVALAAYAGAAIAKGRPLQTGVTATRLAIGAFIIPFVFAYSPCFLFIGGSAGEIILVTATATVGLVGVAAGLTGYLLRGMDLPERVMTLAGGILMIVPSTVSVFGLPGVFTDIAGIVLLAAVVLIQLAKRRRTA